ncbi:RNA-directed DNA polymerase from mobile element jockey [Plakobranchus ocellatus]|uniref:RNA-directed DNA polymerase from mobile element jockey n=1 Tax=Plakobranchus ocellatus TaxID=259542 RepID=A0AAV4AJ25_9GAST|nr:RNA-directed DNA polymerase from mobile element jockey [Plakobranchus ocellatus]
MSHTHCWEYSSRVALAQHWRSAQRVPLFGLRGGRGPLEGVESILGDETIEVTKLGSGDITVELKSNDQAKKLGAIATFLDISVTVSPHKSLSSSKGVIRSCNLRYCSEEKMLEELSGVTHARHIEVRRGEDKYQTDTVVLTFDSPKTPSKIRQSI